MGCKESNQIKQTNNKDKTSSSCDQTSIDDKKLDVPSEPMTQISFKARSLTDVLNSWGILHDPWVCTIITMLVHPSAVSENMLITLEPHCNYYFDQVMHTNACQHYLTTGMCNILF